MDSLNDPSVEEVVVMSSAQVGKTEIINNVVGYFVDHDPCPILVLQPTLEMAEAWSKDRLAPMLRDSPSLKGKVRNPQSRNSGNTLRHKVFPGGHITMAGANSPASLASRPIRVLLADEVDRYPLSAGTEGDPISLGRKRTTTFWNRKVLMTSTPTIKGVSRIEAAYEASSKQSYHVPCPACDSAQRLVWGQVKWEKGELGEPLSDTACYECESCGAQWSDEERWEAIRQGDWVAESPGARVAGFHLNEIYSPWVELSEMVAAFHEARKLPETLKTWVNTALGQTWEEDGESVDHESLYRTRREHYDVLPARALVLTAGVDVQKDRLEFEVVAWSRELESWSVRYERIHGDPARDQVWKDLDAALAETFRHESGKDLTVSAACVDSGGLHTDEVYAHCKRRVHARMWPIKGRGGMGLPVVVNRSKNNRHRVTLFTLGVDTLKGRIYSRLQIAGVGPGYCHFPADYEEGYFLGLTSEKAVTRYSKGRATVVWIHNSTAPNEPLDCRVYAEAAREILRPKWAAFAAHVAVDQPKEEPEALPVPVARHSRPARRRGGFVRNW